MTQPDGTESEASRDTLPTAKPAAANALSASAWVNETTFGTVIVSLAEEALADVLLVAEPLAAEVLAAELLAAELD